MSWYSVRAQPAPRWHPIARRPARSDRPLKRFDQEIVGKLAKLSQDLGIDIHLNMPVQSVERQGEKLIVRAGEQGEREFISGLVVHGAGRVANIDDLDLTAGGVAADETGITVNEYLQSVSNPAVYAGGDAAATPFPLTPAAILQGGMAAVNIIAGTNIQAVDHTGIPSVVYTIPPLASVGFREDELIAQGRKYDKIIKDTSNWFSAKSIGLNKSYMKLLLSQGSQRLLGAHLLIHRAEEVINIFALALRLNLTVGQLKHAIWAYPSYTSDIAYVLG
jgi:glutathione reductase (NADPH)